MGIYRTITGTIKNSQGEVLASGQLYVKATAPVVNSTDFIMPDDIVVDIADGVFTLSLYAPCDYDFLVKDEVENTVWAFQAPLSDDSPDDISLAQLYSDSF